VPRLIAAWAEETRYGAARNGYHGGASPQEMLAPLVLLTDAAARQPALEPAEPRRPVWWDAPPAARPAESGYGAPPARKPRKPSGYLFPLEPPAEAEPVAPRDPRTSPVPATASADWPGRLVRSPIYQAQRQAVRKFAPEEELVVQLLEALTNQGGSMTPAALAHRVGLPAIRLDGLVAKVQRLLNLDGYDVLRLDRQRELVELDVSLLKRQFELE
jgi:hypothetical protein